MTYTNTLLSRRLLATALVLVCTLLKAQSSLAQDFRDFHQFFNDSTLRLDYVFAGDCNRQHIFVDAMTVTPRWYGRKMRLDSLPLRGNGRIVMTDDASGKVIYQHSFSTLFQEWIATDEARVMPKSFENVFLVPYPRQDARITVSLYDYHDRITATITHRVSPQDILIRRPQCRPAYTIVHEPQDTNRCIRIAFVAEGYRQQEMPLFRQHVEEAVQSLFRHEPFRSMENRFQIVAVESPSQDSCTSIPHDGLWIDTALGSHFDTFYSDRYLTTLHLKRLHDLLLGVPYEHIIVLANTNEYGGGGIYNSYTLTYTRGKYFRPVVVHEFGHSFGGLGDEYEYTNTDPMYFSDVEPWEPNLTTKHDFSGKWGNLIREGKASLIEGGGYQKEGVFRGCPDCRMRTNEHPEFCPVCQQALRRLIDFYTEP